VTVCVCVYGHCGVNLCYPDDAATVSMMAPRAVVLPAVPGLTVPLLLTQIVCGTEHTLALTDAGLVFAWGTGTFGRLGVGTDSDVHAPQLVSSLLPHALVGPLGFDALLAERSPVELLDGTHRVVRIAAGANNSAAVTSDGRCYVWGSNHAGQIGDQTTAPSFVPKRVGGAALASGPTGANLAEFEVVDVAVGDRHVLALTRTREVWSWGSNDAGQLGRATAEQPESESRPTRVPWTAAADGDATADTRPLHVYCSTATSVVHTSDGHVWTWGACDTKQLGCGETYDDQRMPTKVSNMPVSDPVAALSVGQLHVVCVMQSGQLVGWGTCLMWDEMGGW
jgi:alpha-tubulin suppressor-like RCC1 family protein